MTRKVHSGIRFFVCLLFLIGAIHVLEGYAEQRRRIDNSSIVTYWEFDAQEKHIDAVDKVSQDNKEKIQQILVRIEGDEDYVKGASFIVLGMISLGAFKLVRGKPA